MVSTLGITFSLQGTFLDSNLPDRLVRLVLAALSLYILFSFNDVASTFVSFLVLAAIAYWMVYRRKTVQGETEVVVAPGSLTPAPVNATLGRMD
jgi:ABC-type iron transport system FetAB permease component